jgi:hypothetical protein
MWNNLEPTWHQRSCSFVSSVLNIQLNVSPFLSQICRQFCVRYTLCLLPNAAAIGRFVLFQLRSHSNPRELQFCIYRLEYSLERISAAVIYMWKIRCALHSIIAAKYSARQPICAMSTLFPVKSSVFAVLHIQASIFKSMFLFSVSVVRMSTIWCAFCHVPRSARSIAWKQNWNMRHATRKV